MNASLETPQVIILLGPPGAGKGTHAPKLSQHLQVPHISTGDLFRYHLKEKTTLGEIADKYIQKGELVPDDIVIDMVIDRLSESDCKNGCILDGFPRTTFQAVSLESKVTDKIIKAIYFKASDEILFERITGRLCCKECNAVYHKSFFPPKEQDICDKCQSTLFQRKDDTKEVLKKRLEVYHLQTDPLIHFYDKKNALTEINVENTNSLEDIFQDILFSLKETTLSPS
ncbi:MAG: adenylate kinase [Chlamydiae bacterium CG10_big_fil_rev_8_21_14_0_10_35_9]|nr:MAG: adenylate kinase [Chlamydiae bacterium CG10_big_fil_rev_8_21_14_0_10_35_9]